MRILSPSLRALPLNGIEFSFQMRDEGYTEEGFYSNDSRDDEESVPPLIEMH